MFYLNLCSALDSSIEGPCLEGWDSQLMHCMAAGFLFNFDNLSWVQQGSRGVIEHLSCTNGQPDGITFCMGQSFFDRVMNSSVINSCHGHTAIAV